MGLLPLIPVPGRKNLLFTISSKIWTRIVLPETHILKLPSKKINAYQQFVQRQHVGVGDTATTKVITTVLILVPDEVGAHFEALSPGALASLEGASVPLDAVASGVIPLVDVVQPKRRVSRVPL